MLGQSGVARSAIAALAFIAVSTASLLSSPPHTQAAGPPPAAGGSPPPQPGVEAPPLPQPAIDPSPYVAMSPAPPLTLPQLLRVQRDPSLMRQWMSGLPSQSLRSAPPPTSGNWALGPQPAGAPPLANPLLLTDGSVIALGSGCAGTNQGIWYRLTPDVTGSYLNGSWAQIASLPLIGSQYSPRFFSSEVLPDGRVLIEGGEYNGSGCTNVALSNTQGAIYDPTVNTWTAVAPPAGWGTIGDAESIILANGTYMQSDCCQSPFKAALLNASNLSWSPTGAGKADTYDEEGWTLLPNGNVLTVDIQNQCTSTTNGWEIYNSVAGTWSTGSPAIPLQLADCTNFNNASFEMGPQVLRPDGTVVAFAGTLCSDAAFAACANGTDVTTSHTAIYNSSPGTWSAGPDIPAVVTNGTSRNYTLADAPAALLPSGNVLFAASPNYQGFVAPTHFFEYAANNTIAQVADPTDFASFTSFQWNFLVLPTGQIMALETDGSNVWLYTPSGSPNPSWAPAVTGFPPDLTAGATYAISCTQCNGLSQGAAYGDDVQAATNYPLVQITNNASGHVYYARTFNHSTMSVNPGTAGSTNFTVPANLEAGPSNLSIIANGIASPAVTPAAARVLYAKGADFNGDHMADLLLRFTDGTLVIWLMNADGTVLSSVNLGQVPLSWQIAGVGDFNGDGVTDILWRKNDGTVAIWLLNTSAQVTSSVSLGVVSNSYTIVATGDFNGDTKADILWRNASTGDIAMWLMNGTTVSNSFDLGVVTTDWQIAGIGNFDFSPNTGILWRNTTSGDAAMWLMNGQIITSSTDLGIVPLNWTIDGTGDFDGNGTADILWRNAADGTQAIWFMHGATVVHVNYVGFNNGIPVSEDYQIVATGDFNGDGQADILWRSASTGTFSIWLIVGGIVESQVPAGGLALSTQWTLAQ